MNYTLVLYFLRTRTGCYDGITASGAADVQVRKRATHTMADGRVQRSRSAADCVLRLTQSYGDYPSESFGTVWYACARHALLNNELLDDSAAPLQPGRLLRHCALVHGGLFACSWARARTHKLTRPFSNALHGQCESRFDLGRGHCVRNLVAKALKVTPGGWCNATSRECNAHSDAYAMHLHVREFTLKNGDMYTALHRERWSLHEQATVHTGQYGRD